IGGGGNDRLIRRDNVIAVYKVNARSFRKVTKQRREIARTKVELIPSHVRNLQIQRRGIDVEADAVAFENAKALVCSVLVPDIEEQLQAEANPQERFAG